MGPDNSGRALIRVFRNRGFLSKMFRTKAVSMYGLRTVLSGTLLPARPIALAFPEVMRDLKARGLRSRRARLRSRAMAGSAGYHRRRWHSQRARRRVRSVSRDPRSILRAASRRRDGAPTIRHSLALDEANLAYRSDTRGTAFPIDVIVDGRILKTVEIPTTLPTLDEVMGRDEIPDASAAHRFYLEQFKEDALNVHTVHAETEGMGQLEMFTELLRALKERGAQFVRLEEVASSLDAAQLPVCPVIRSTLPGRAGWISAQGRRQPPKPKTPPAVRGGPRRRA